MKRITFLFITLINFAASVTSQEQLPLENGRWKGETVDCTVDDFFNFKTYSYTTYDEYSLGDTTINDTVYQAFYTSYEGYVGGVRQDSCLVYFRPSASISEDTCEVVLYDFGVTDSFAIKRWGYTFVVDVSLIDSVSINGKMHKRIRFEENGVLGKYWIEGIGSNSGLLKPYFPTAMLPCICFCGSEDNLVCLSVDDENLFLNDKYNSCETREKVFNEAYFTAECIGDGLSNSQSDHLYIKDDSIFFECVRSHQCCAAFELNVSEIRSNQVIVELNDTAQAQCDCMCPFAIKIYIGLAHGGAIKLLYDHATYSAIGVGIEQTTSQSDMRVYPNPSLGTISFLNLPDRDNLHYEIISLSGKTMAVGNVESSINTDLKNGVYVILVKDEKTVIFHERLIIIAN